MTSDMHPINTALLDIAVTIPQATILTYTINTRFIRSKYVSRSKLAIVNPLMHFVPVGTRVRIGDNKYILVNEFTDNLEILSNKITNNNNKIKLIPGTIIEQENGIMVPLIQELDVEVPDNLKIIVKAGTKLQQIDNNVELVLQSDQPAEIITNSYSNRSPYEYMEPQVGDVGKPGITSDNCAIYSESAAVPREVLATCKANVAVGRVFVGLN